MISYSTFVDIMSSLSQLVENNGSLPDDIILVSANPQEQHHIEETLERIRGAFDGKPPNMIIFDESWHQTCEEDLRPVRYLLQDSCQLSDDEIDSILS